MVAISMSNVKGCRHFIIQKGESQTYFGILKLKNVGFENVKKKIYIIYSSKYPQKNGGKIEKFIICL